MKPGTPGIYDAAIKSIQDVPCTTHVVNRAGVATFSMHLNNAEWSGEVLF